MKARTLLPALAATLLLAACSGLLPKSEPFDVYRLPQTATAPAAATGTLDWQLRVDTPEAARMLSGPRIVVVPDASRVSVYGGARWSQAAPKLLRDRLVDAFRDDGRVPMVSSDDDGLSGDFELGASLGAFQAEYRGGDQPVAVIRLDAWLIRSGASQPVANHRFEAVETAAGSDVPGVVAAFGRAADRLSAELVAWTIEQAAAHPATTP